jgi:hypothetical protein
MPITYRIDRERRLVIATGGGVITDAEVFGYQQEVWSRPENSAYNELIDMTGVSDIEFVSPERVAKLANLSSSMDAPGSPSKLAIIATNDLHFGLGRMYQAHREMAKESTKAVRVFRSREVALEWLGVSIKPTR